MQLFLDFWINISLNASSCLNEANCGLVQFSSVSQSCPTLYDPMNRSTPGNSRSPLKLMPIESVMPSSHLILCRPLFHLPRIPPIIRVFSNESTLCMRWPKYWSFSCSISPSNEHLGLISFSMDWLDLFAVQGTLRVFSNTTGRSTSREKYQ